MTQEFILQILTAILVFISFLFAFFLLSVKGNIKRSNQILAAYLILKALDASVLLWGKYFSLHPILDMLRHDVGAFFQAPLLFLFVLSILYDDFRFKRIYLWFIVPFLLSVLISLPEYYLPHLGIRLGVFDGFHPYFEITFTYVLGGLQNLSFILATFWLLNRYKKTLIQNYSISDLTTYSWLMRLNFLSLFIFCTALIKNIYKFSDNPANVTLFRIAIVLVMLVFVCWIVLTALHAPQIFNGIDSKLHNGKSKMDDSASLNEVSGNEQVLIEIKRHMDTEMPFLDPHLTIAELAQQLDLNPRVLSELINKGLGTDFHNFINSYRVEQAKKMLRDGNKKMSIKEILYAVGFSSKSSFNSSFKKVTGVTPSEYRASV